MSDVNKLFYMGAPPKRPTSCKSFIEVFQSSICIKSCACHKLCTNQVDSSASSQPFSLTRYTNQIRMLLEEKLDQVFSRHCRLAEATRAAVKAWGLEINALNPSEYSNSLTAVMLPQGHDADAFRKRVLECFNVSLGNGLGRLNGNVFRIGHLGDFNEPMLLGTLGAIEMGLELAKIPHRSEGVRAAMSHLVDKKR